MFKKIISLWLCALLMLCSIPIQAYAAAVTLYETVEDTVVVRQDKNDKGKIMYRIYGKGSIVRVVGSEYNWKLSKWYKLEDGNWVFAERVKKHVHKAILCGLEKISYAQPNEESHRKTTTYDEICACGHVVTTTANVAAAEQHSYVNGVCRDCGKAHAHVFAGQRVFQNITENAHDLVMYNGGHACSCGMPLPKRNETSYTHPHSFNATTGKCECGYVKQTTAPAEPTVPTVPTVPSAPPENQPTVPEAKTDYALPALVVRVLQKNYDNYRIAIEVMASFTPAVITARVDNGSELSDFVSHGGGLWVCETTIPQEQDIYVRIDAWIDADGNWRKTAETSVSLESAVYEIKELLAAQFYADRSQLQMDSPEKNAYYTLCVERILSEYGITFINSHSDDNSVYDVLYEIANQMLLPAGDSAEQAYLLLKGWLEIYTTYDYYANGGARRAWELSNLSVKTRGVKEMLLQLQYLFLSNTLILNESDTTDAIIRAIRYDQVMDEGDVQALINRLKNNNRAEFEIYHMEWFQRKLSEIYTRWKTMEAIYVLVNPGTWAAKSVRGILTSGKDVGSAILALDGLKGLFSRPVDGAMKEYAYIQQRLAAILQDY